MKASHWKQSQGTETMNLSRFMVKFSGREFRANALAHFLHPISRLRRSDRAIINLVRRPMNMSDYTLIPQKRQSETYIKIAGGSGIDCLAVVV